MGKTVDGRIDIFLRRGLRFFLERMYIYLCAFTLFPEDVEALNRPCAMSNFLYMEKAREQRSSRYGRQIIIRIGARAINLRFRLRSKSSKNQYICLHTQTNKSRVIRLPHESILLADWPNGCPAFSCPILSHFRESHPQAPSSHHLLSHCLHLARTASLRHLLLRPSSNPCPTCWPNIAPGSSDLRDPCLAGWRTRWFPRELSRLRARD